MLFTKLHALYGRAKYIIHDEGVVYFIWLVISRLRKSIFNHEIYYLYLKELIAQDEIEFAPKIQNVTLEIICTPERFDDLNARGYQFDSLVSRKMINKGAIAFCVFVNRELGNITWVATNRETKKFIDPIPYSVDFQNGEVCHGSARTSAKYRKQGLVAYGNTRMFRFLREEGKTVDKFTIPVSNVASLNAAAKYNPKIMKLEYCRFFFWVNTTITPITKGRN